MQLILTRNLSPNSLAQPAADYMKIVFAHTPHILIKRVVSTPEGTGPFSKKEKIIVDYGVLPGSMEDIETSIRSALAMRSDLQLTSLELPNTSCKFSPQF